MEGEYSIVLKSEAKSFSLSMPRCISFPLTKALGVSADPVKVSAATPVR